MHSYRYDIGTNSFLIYFKGTDGITTTVSTIPVTSITPKHTAEMRAMNMVSRLNGGKAEARPNKVTSGYMRPAGNIHYRGDWQNKGFTRC